MKAITLWQPWASLMAWGAKEIETRTWATKHRGPLAIHAAAQIPKGLGLARQSPEFRAQYRITGAGAGNDDYNALPRGAVLCIVDLVDCVEITDGLVADLTTRELTFGNYEFGRYAWHTKHIKLFDQPIPAPGNRLLWEWKVCSACYGPADMPLFVNPKTGVEQWGICHPCAKLGNVEWANK